MRNRSIVRNYLSCLEESGSISKVNFKPLIVSPLNLVPKSNGAPRLIHDLSKICSLSEWSFIISIAVSSDHSQLRFTGFAGSI